jgi:parvulin-like peptidyl-prolyl isomerase
MQFSARMLAGLAGTVLVAATAAAQTPQPQPNPNRTVVLVNGEPITQREVDAVIAIGKGPNTQPISKEQQKELEANAVNLLVEDLLMRQYLRKNVQAVPPAEIDKEMKDLIADLAKQKPPMTLADFLKETGQTEQQLRNDMGSRLQWKNYVSPQLTDQVVKQYYDTNKIFFDKVLVRASHILLSVPANANQNDRQMIYNRLAAIRQEIMAGKIQFAEAAAKYSDCPSKQHGGDIGLFPYKFAVLPPFAQAAFSMKVGDLSDVVATDYGYHLIKVTDRTNGQPSNFEVIKTEVKEVYAQEIYQSIITEQRRTAKIDRQ